MHKVSLAIQLLALVLLLGVAVVAQELTPRIVDQAEAEKWRADLRFMAEAMPKYHRNLFHTMTRQQFETAVAELDKRIPNLARHQIIVELARIVAMVGDGHTNIAPTRDPKVGFHNLPIKLYYFDDGLYVRSATNENRDLIGATVLEIGGKPVVSVFNEVGKLIGRDNEMDLKFFAPFLMTMPEVLHALGVTETADEVSFVFLKDGKKLTAKLKPVGETQLMPPDTDLSWIPQTGWTEARAISESPLWLKDPQNKFWFQSLPQNRAVYVQINQIGNKDDESMEAFCTRLLSFINSNPVEKVIVDLRLNRGGNGDFNKPVLRTLIKADKIDHKGKLFVLIGRSTWSAAQFLVNNLEDYTEAIFVGEPSGGKRNSYGDSRRIVLPNSGVTVRVSTLWWQEDERDRRQWKAPDLAADLTFEDYRKNTDPALTIALDYVPGKSLTDLISEAVSRNDVAAASEIYSRWRSAKINRYINAEVQVNRLGYELLNQKQIDRAIEVFKLNVTQYPMSSNAFDSLADAYLARGDKELARKNYQRALELDPTNISSREALERLKSGQ